MPKVHIAAVTAADDKLTVRTVEVDSLHCKHSTAAWLSLNTEMIKVDTFLSATIQQVQSSMETL